MRGGESQVERGNLRDETGGARKRTEGERVSVQEGRGGFGMVVIGAFS
jgi:hypothetical protein